MALNHTSVLRKPSIKTKLAFGVALIYAIVLSAFVYEMLTRQREFLLDSTLVNAIKQAQLTADAASSWALARDVVGMAEILQTSHKDNITKFAMFLDLDGKVLAHTDHTREGFYVNSEHIIEILQISHNTEVWQEGSLILVAAPIKVMNEILGWTILGTDITPLNNHIKNIGYNGLAYALLAMSIGTLLTWLLTRFVLRQLNTITTGIDRMKRDILDVPILVCSEDEVGAVAEVLNSAMHSLLISREEVKREVQKKHYAERRISYLARRLIDGNEEYRKQFGHELHDELGQMITGFHFGLHSLRDLLSEDEKTARELCNKLIGYTEGVGESLRRIAANAWPLALEHLGLAAATESYVNESAELHQKISFSFFSNLPKKRFAPDVELALYRITQEAVQNTTRHAEAKQVDVSLTVYSGMLTLCIVDDGKGFDSKDLVENWKEEFSGIGLIGMHIRALAIGGIFEVTSTTGSGSTVQVMLPIAHEKHL